MFGVLSVWGGRVLFLLGCAIIFGRPKNENNPKYEKRILQGLAEFGLTDMPVVTHFDIRHTDPIMVMPMGCMAKLDCDKHTFEITENAVV